MKILIIQIVNKYLIKLKNTMTHKYTTLNDYRKTRFYKQYHKY